jgi:PAS domain S-box-containing protein
MSDPSAAKREDADAYAGKLLRTVFIASSVPTAIARVADGEILLANPACLQALGWQEDEFVGKTLEQVGLWTQSQRHEILVATSRDQGRVRDLEVDVRSKGGETKTVLMSVEPLWLDGSQCLIGTHYELTDSHRRDTELRQSEERFRQVTENVQQGFWLRDVDPPAVLYASPGVEHIFGVRRDAFYRDPLALEALIHPDDREAVIAKRDAMTDPGDLEFRIVRPDGETRWIRSRSAAVLTEHGRVRRLAAVTEDVTDERQLREALRASERQFRWLVDSVSEYAIVMLDPQGRVAAWNTGAERIKGYSAAEIIGRHFSVFYPPELVAAGHPAQELEAALAAGRYQDDGERVRKDGSRFWADVTLTPVHDETGELRGFAKITRDITERNESEEALRESEERFRMLAENSRDLIRSYDADGTIRYASPSCRAVLGYDPDELVGRSSSELQHPDELPGRDARRRAVIATDGDSTVTYRSRRKDGSYVWLEANVRALRDGQSHKLVGFQEAARDITERRRAEESLRESEERFRLLAENSTDVIARSSTDAVIRYISPASRLLYGYEPKDMIGRSGWEFIHPDDLVALRHDVATRGARPVDATNEYRVKRRDGRYVWVEARSHALRDPVSREVIEFHTSVRDITERKQAEAAVGRAREEAERANNAKSEFLSRMSHELRTPLHAILGFGELLGREILAEAQRDKLMQIFKAGHHLLDLVDEVMDLSRIERGELGVSLEPVHLGELVQETLAMVSPLASARSVTVAAPVAEDLDIHVLADRQRLKQVLLNLLSNAVKYNRERGEVRLACARAGSAKVRIEVADTGPGIADDELTRVFDPFERIGAEATDVEGTGLGLALSNRLVEAMSGQIGVESELGEGTTFWLELASAVAPKAGRAPSDSAPAIAAERIRGPARTVVYVEDNPSNVKLVETILAERPEVTLIVAMQGGLAVELVREHRPALVLLDLNLPDVSGEEVLATLRSDARTSDIPIVVVSADATPGQIARLRRAGADDYLTKPFGLERFLAVIDGSPASEPANPMGREGSSVAPVVLDRGAILALHELASRPNVGATAVGELVEVFLVDALERLAALQIALAGEDLADVAREAHALRGASGGVGAAQLTSLCRELEVAAKQGDVQRARSVISRLGEALADTRVALQAQFRRSTPTGPTAS